MPITKIYRTTPCFNVHSLLTAVRNTQPTTQKGKLLVVTLQIPNRCVMLRFVIPNLTMLLIVMLKGLAFVIFTAMVRALVVVPFVPFIVLVLVSIVMCGQAAGSVFLVIVTLSSPRRS
uniref:Transmembrane protein n=1 Tax=Pseudictyota dubia TaxID=2749911 RepID=A0A7R9VZA5_9STRA|mmetsp:Transcript_2719/g.4894  ORF Transcript_2719/g.4894 Transcript_2719/m.4894 type:complete len:118 (+) Transcript_2719:47-400(+)